MSIKQFTGGSGGGAAISLSPNYVAIGAEYCEPNGDGLNTGRRLVKQMDINPYSETFQKDRIFVVAEKSDVCPISNEPFYKPTGNKRCKRDDHNRYTGGTEQEERDVNPRSPGFNSSRWVDGPDDLRGCPLPELPFLRVLGENAGAVNGFKISATIKDGSGQLFTVTCLSDGTGAAFADLYRDFGTYTLIGMHVEYYAGVAVNKFISRIVLSGVTDQVFVQYDPVNTPAGGSCTIDVAGSWELILNENRAIRFVFSDRVAAGQFTATRTAAFTRNNCGLGKTGTSVNFTKTYSSFVSQADADNKKAADTNFDTDGQAFANDPVNGAMCTINENPYNDVFFVLEPFEKFLKVSGENPVGSAVTITVNYNTVNTDSFGNPIETFGPYTKTFTLPAGQTEKLSTGIVAGDYFRIDILDFTFTPAISGMDQIIINGQKGIPGQP